MPQVRRAVERRSPAKPVPFTDSEEALEVVNYDPTAATMRKLELTIDRSLEAAEERYRAQA